MFSKNGLKFTQLVNDPRARAIFVLATMIAAIMAGGAPSSGGHG
jgi:hypothetical protein